MVMAIDGNVDTGVARGLDHLSRLPYWEKLNNAAIENRREAVQSKQINKRLGSPQDTKTSDKDTSKQ